MDQISYGRDREEDKEWTITEQTNTHCLLIYLAVYINLPGQMSQL